MLSLSCDDTGFDQWQTSRGQRCSILRFCVRSLIFTQPSRPAGWQSGYAAACKAVYAGSIPTPASKYL